MRQPFNIVLRDCKVKYTGVYTRTYNSIGKLFCFDMRIIKGSRSFMLRATSKQRDFKELYSVDHLDDKFEPDHGVQVRNQRGKSSSEVVEVIAKSLMDPKQLAEKSDMLRESFMLMEDDSKGSIFGRIKSITKNIFAVMGKNLSEFLTAVFMTLCFFDWIYIMYKNWRSEKVSNNDENKLNQELFGTQNGQESEFECYNKMVRSINLVIDNPKVKSLIICGLPGTSKTYMVRRTIYFKNLRCPSDYSILKGSTMSLIDFCSALYENRERLLVLDDFDKPLEDADLVNILKSATDSYSKRIISIPRVRVVEKDGGDVMDLPTKFEFNGKLIIITNKQFKEIDKALISRSLTIEINFTQAEFLQNIKQMLKYIMEDVDMEIKQEVFNYVCTLVQKDKIKHLNFRSFQSAISIRLLYDDWKEMIAYVLK